MGKVKISSKQPEVRIRSSYPSFFYFFKDADVPVEVEESHAEKILSNSNFYISDGKVSNQKDELDDLLKIKGVGKKNVEDLKKIYAGKEDLIVALEKDEVPLRDDIVEKLKAKLLNTKEDKDN